MPLASPPIQPPGHSAFVALAAQALRCHPATGLFEPRPGISMAEKEYGMDRSQKADLVAELKSVFSETSVVVITRNLGMTVAQSTDLRLKMRDAGAQFKVAKNRLALIALEGTRYGAISDMLTGPTALATSTDPVAAAKVAVDFAKTNDKLEIVGGAMGDTLLDVNGIKALAALPSLDQLRGTLVGLLQAPATKIARIVIEPASLLARVTGAYAAKAA
jgi:large subunit ribosomal protein L10